MIQQSHQSMDMWKMSMSLLSSNGIPWVAIRHDLHNKPDLRVRLTYGKPNLANYGTRLCTIWEKQNLQQNPPSHTLIRIHIGSSESPVFAHWQLPFPIKRSGTLGGRFFTFLVWNRLCCSLFEYFMSKIKAAANLVKGISWPVLIDNRKQSSPCQ